MIKRDDALKSMSGHTFDVLVIGGGVTGAGVALDAASRGYSVALIERDDFACGTSSRSSKMVHGGLRYLQNFDIALVREALIERRIMVELAPHLVWPTPFLVTAFEGERIDRKIGVGLNMYDAMQRGQASRRAEKQRRAELAGLSLRQYRRQFDEQEWSPERHRMIDGDEVKQRVPALAGRDPKSAYLFYDCQTDDVRLTLTILGEAERFGAVLANRLEAGKLIERNGKVMGAIAHDHETGSDFEIQARHVVNATGVWADRVKPTDVREADVPIIRPSRGTHVTFAHEDLPLTDTALVVPAGGGRMMFTLPWMGRTLVGTTDNDYEGELDHIAPPDDDVEYILDGVNEFFGTSLGFGDVTGAYAGVRPLISTGDPKKSVDISRKAELYETPGGMITITGGKLTTWRPMAEMVVDKLVARDRREAPARTEEIPLGLPIEPQDLPVASGVDEAAREHLAARYGYAAKTVIELVRADHRLAEPVVDGLPDRLAEIALAARGEQARSLSDVLLRRTRLGLTAARQLVPVDGSKAPAPAVERVAHVLADELGWDATRRSAEISRWHDEARAEGIAPGS
ncbi:MAG TPA: glycerol-3-phosphate dehydrogenase/oxidase [Solirubrobacterales bacterium]|jgi:glycerol-3-phosphate dehydrogenase|nr:glycerol-3-phosphate dehydrogenase/oxidase [Solirubrobacterales bacterium]